MSLLSRRRSPTCLANCGKVSSLQALLPEIELWTERSGRQRAALDQGQTAFGHPRRNTGPVFFGMFERVTQDSKYEGDRHWPGHR